MQRFIIHELRFNLRNQQQLDTFNSVLTVAVEATGSTLIKPARITTKRSPIVHVWGSLRARMILTHLHRMLELTQGVVSETNRAGASFCPDGNPS